VDVVTLKKRADFYADAWGLEKNIAGKGKGYSFLLFFQSARKQYLPISPYASPKKLATTAE